jgi:nucleotide-binding universal stress UspA family protein
MRPNPVIVVGLDGSERAPAVLEAALAVARAFQGKLLLLRAVGIPTEIPHEAFTMPAEELPLLLMKLAERDLARWASKVPAELLLAHRARLGVPWQAIVDEAKHANADLVVVGSHGYGGLDRILGTTAAKVVNQAPCSTLVVRAPA